MINTFYNFRIQPQQYNFRQQQRPVLPNQPCRDTVSFASVNLLKKESGEITKIVKDVIDNTEKIGFGSEGEVFKIPDTNYCVKIMKGESTRFFGDWKMNVSEQDKINNIVARAENDAVIMNYLEGQPLKWNKPDEIYDLPKSAYKNLLKQMQRANDECMKFDNSPRNVIYNPKEKTLTAIDFYEPSPDVEFEYTPLSTTFSVLHNHSASPEHMKNNRNLAGKLLDVVLDELSSGKKPEFEIDRYDVFKLFGQLRMSQNLNEAPQMRYLREAFSDIFRLKDLPKTEENTRIFNGKVKYSKAIIKQELGQ